MIRSSWAWKSSWRSSTPTARPSSGGSGWSAGQQPALDPEQVCRRAAWDQVAVQDGLRLVLEPGAVAHDVRSAADLAAQRLRDLIGLVPVIQEIGIPGQPDVKFFAMHGVFAPALGANEQTSEL